MNLYILLASGLAITIVIGGLVALQIPQEEALLPENSPVESVPLFKFPDSPPDLLQIKYDANDFLAHRGGAANKELRLDRGMSRTITVEIIPTSSLNEITMFKVGLKPEAGTPPGVEITFSPEEFLVAPGETTSFVITIQADDNAEETATLFSYQITSNAFPGRRSAGFEILVGNASPIPRDIPLVEEIKQIQQDKLEAYLADGWEIYQELDSGEYLVKRVAPENP